MTRCTPSSAALNRRFAQAGDFDGALRLILKRAEAGLFERFPSDAMFALPHMPDFPVGEFGFKEGPFMASSESVTEIVMGRGGHGSPPHLRAAPVVAAAHIVCTPQTSVSRNVDPRNIVVVSVRPSSSTRRSTRS